MPFASFAADSIMTISSRTPADPSDNCPLCNTRVRIADLSAMFGDTTCSNCGGLLWFLFLEPEMRIYERSASRPVRNRVIAFIANQLGVAPEKIAENSFSIEDLGTDSLNTIELVMKLEKEIQLP